VGGQEDGGAVFVAQPPYMPPDLVLADETDADPDDPPPGSSPPSSSPSPARCRRTSCGGAWAGQSLDALLPHVRSAADRAFDLIESGVGDYAVKEG
jgi:hypothetical protein